MTADELRSVLWLRAVEQAATAAPGAGAVPWAAADAEWASAEARRRLGEQAGADTFVVERARLGLQRLRERDPAWAALVQARAGMSLWLRAAIVGAALGLALAIVGDVIGPSRRLNLIAPGLLALLLWNGAVYLLIGAARLRPRPAPQRLDGWLPRLMRGVEMAMVRVGDAARSPALAAARARHALAWAEASAELHGQRLAASLHGAAALLALAVVASMYLLGLVVDYRAGWDSTWLDAGGVRAVLGVVLGPAAALSGLALPDAAVLAPLRWAEGGAGESAARWIHLYAITLGLGVIAPRLLLAAWALRRAGQAASGWAWPADDPYFRALRLQAPAPEQPVSVLPYSYTLGDIQRAALPAALREAFGVGARLRLSAALPMGAEDELATTLPDDLAGTVAALFAATATPERETHGAFVRALQRALAGRASVAVLVDESGLRAHAGTAADAELRLQRRRDAWQRLMSDLSLPAPRFIDLGRERAR